MVEDAGGPVVLAAAAVNDKQGHLIRDGRGRDPSHATDAAGRAGDQRHELLDLELAGVESLVGVRQIADWPLDAGREIRDGDDVEMRAQLVGGQGEILRPRVACLGRKLGAHGGGSDDHVRLRSSLAGKRWQVEVNAMGSNA